MIPIEQLLWCNKCREITTHITNRKSPDKPEPPKAKYTCNDCHTTHTGITHAGDLTATPKQRGHPDKNRDFWGSGTACRWNDKDCDICEN